MRTKEQLHGFIDSMPEYALSIVAPILAHFANEPFIETDITDEEKAIAEKGYQLYQKHPEQFITLEEYHARRKNSS